MIPAKTNQDTFLCISPKNDVQNYMLTAALRGTIRDSERKETFELLNIVLDGICKDVGIKSSIEDMDKARLMDITFKYFSGLTVSEIKLAFELCIVGELDMFLPRDRDGNPDKNHYQFFSVEYYTKILRAYKRKKEKIKAEAPKLALPPQDLRAEKAYYKEVFNKLVRDLYEKFINDGETPDAPFPWVILRSMKDVGLFDGFVRTNPEEMSQYILKSISMMGNVHKKKKAINDIKEGRSPMEIQLEYEAKKENEMLREIFIEIQQSQIPITNYFPEKVNIE